MLTDCFLASVGEEQAPSLEKEEVEVARATSSASSPPESSLPLAPSPLSGAEEARSPHRWEKHARASRVDAEGCEEMQETSGAGGDAK